MLDNYYYYQIKKKLIYSFSTEGLPPPAQIYFPITLCTGVFYYDTVERFVPPPPRSHRQLPRDNTLFTNLHSSPVSTDNDTKQSRKGTE